MFFIKVFSFVIWFAYLCIISKIRIFSSFLKYSNKYFIFKVDLIKPQNFEKSPSILCPISQIIGGDFAKLCGLLRIYELYHMISIRPHF